MKTDEHIKELAKNTVQKLLEDTERYMESKKQNWQHLTIIVATILGFSLGIQNIIGGKVNIFLLIAWILQILTILLGISLLVLEAESSYYRKITSHDAYLEMLGTAKKEGDLPREEIQKILSNFVEEIYGRKKEEKEKKKKIYQWFNRNFSKVEGIFYFFLLFSFLFLILSFFLI